MTTPATPMIRLLTPTDAEAYRAIRLATLQTEPAYFGALYEDERQRPIEAFQNVLTEDQVFAACLDQTIIGVARLHGHTAAKERHKATLHGVFVQPEWRGKGIGAAMLRATIAAAATTYERLTLTVAAENLTAIQLYERLGFERYGLEPQARKHGGQYFDVLSMSLKLSSAP